MLEKDSIHQKYVKATEEMAEVKKEML